MSKPPPPAPTASAIGPCPTVIKIVGRPGTGSLPSTIAPPDHPPIWSGHEKLTDRQMDGLTDDKCLDIQLAIPTSNALPICIIFFFDRLINEGKTLLRHETVLYKLEMLKN